MPNAMSNAYLENSLEHFRQRWAEAGRSRGTALLDLLLAIGFQGPGLRLGFAAVVDLVGLPTVALGDRDNAELYYFCADDDKAPDQRREMYVHLALRDGVVSDFSTNDQKYFDALPAFRWVGPG